MAAEDKYKEMLDKVCNKLSNLETVKEDDVTDIKNSVESIENLMTDTQAKLNFQEIKNKLEKIAHQVDNCNDSLLKDLYNDLNTLKERTGSVTKSLESLQNSQNLALTSAEFEEYQKQQLDLALKTNENIFNELKVLNEKTATQANPENIKNLETQLNNLHSTLQNYIEQLVTKIELVPGVEEIGSVVSDYSLMQQKGIKQTNAYLKILETKLDQFKTEFDGKDFGKQIARISEIYDSLGMINAWIEKVGYINQSIDNVYARLGENIDFDDVSDKIDIIYENITSLNNWTMKIDKVDGSVLEVQSKLSDLNKVIEDTKNISETINFLKEKVGSLESFNQNCDFEDLTNKLDIVYENLSAINQWANKIDIVSDSVENYNGKFNNFAEKINDVSVQMENYDGKFTDVSDKIDDVSEKIENITNKIDVVNGLFEEESIFSKVDVVYENISLLNQWVGKIDDLTQKSEVLDVKHSEANDRLNFRIDELTETLEKTVKIIEDVPNIKDKLESISTELHTVTSSAKTDTDSYIYTLLDIESDFLKLHKFLDDKTSITSNDINALKERFSELNDDISSISIRTNKLILSADDANKEFKTYLEAFKQTIHEFDAQRQEINPELRFSLLGEQINEATKLMQESNNASKNLNNAFIYLADWVDATGSLLNSMQLDVAEMKNNNDNAISLKIIQNDVSDLIDQVNGIEEAFNNYKKNDLSILKEAVSYIITKLDEVGEELNNKDIDGVSNSVTSVADTINGLQDELTSVKTANADIKEELTDMNDKIGSFSDELTSIKEDVNKVGTVASITDEMSVIKDNFTKLSEKMNEIDNSFSNFKVDDISEIKSSLTGIMVQLNTALTPDIDSLNERIDKLTEQQNNKMSELETLLQEKISIQEKQINGLEEKVTSLTTKFDKLIGVMSEDSKTDEIKDILNYVITQLSSMNENMLTQQNMGAAIKSIDEKVNSFDENINKIVSYIEEE